MWRIYKKSMGEIIMEEKGLKKLFTLLFVKYPVGYIVLLAAGVIAFALVALNIDIPVYETVEVSCHTTDNQLMLDMKDHLPSSNQPIYVYQSREERVDKVEQYKVDQVTESVTANINQYKDLNKIKVDVQTGEVNLWSYIFTSKEGLK